MQEVIHKELSTNNVPLLVVGAVAIVSAALYYFCWSGVGTTTTTTNTDPGISNTNTAPQPNLDVDFSDIWFPFINVQRILRQLPDILDRILISLSEVYPADDNVANSILIFRQIKDLVIAMTTTVTLPNNEIFMSYLLASGNPPYFVDIPNLLTNIQIIWNLNFNLLTSAGMAHDLSEQGLHMVDRIETTSLIRIELLDSAASLAVALQEIGGLLSDYFMSLSGTAEALGLILT